MNIVNIAKKEKVLIDISARCFISAATTRYVSTIVDDNIGYFIITIVMIVWCAYPLLEIEAKE